MAAMCSGKFEVGSFSRQPALEQGLVFERRRGGRRGVGDVNMCGLSRDNGGWRSGVDASGHYGV
jgi:hypothetical protein